MAIVRLPDEELPAFPGKPVAVYYSTEPVDLDGLMREVGALDCIVMTGIGTEHTRPKRPDEKVDLYDIIVINMNHSLRPKPEDRLRRNYQVIGTLQNGYKIRELPFTLIFEEDVPEVFRMMVEGV